jgi:hypothetical protein
MKNKEVIEYQPIPIIQIIHCNWTKMSRGMPNAALRNTVPERLPIPLDLIDSQTAVRSLYHEVFFEEKNEFQNPRVRLFTNLVILPVSGCTKIENTSQEIIAIYRYHSSQSRGGAPNRGALQHRLKSSLNNWVQVMENGRFSHGFMGGDWKYQKIVVNAGLFDCLNTDYFIDQPPTQTFSSMADLW